MSDLSGPSLTFLKEHKKCELNEYFLAILLSPKAKRTGITGQHDNHLKIGVSAPPTDGKANQALINYLSKILKISKSNLSIIQGELSRNKLVSVSGITFKDLKERLTNLLNI